MSSLSIYPEDRPDNLLFETNDAKQIESKLAELGVTFRHWELKDLPISEGADDKDISDKYMELYKEEIKELQEKGGYKSVDIVRFSPDNPNKDEARKKYLSEHIHHDDEVRFFIDGSGMFYLHCGGKIYMLLCQAGDMINVPAGAAHWFDMGDKPSFTCIRFFTVPDGWKADFTGSDIAEKFPKYENEQSERAA